MTDRKLRVFLCHSSQDKPIVREPLRASDSTPKAGLTRDGESASHHTGWIILING